MSNTRVISLDITIPKNTGKNIFYHIPENRELQDFFGPHFNFGSIDNLGFTEYEAPDSETEINSVTFTIPLTINIDEVIEHYQSNLTTYVKQKLIEKYGEEKNIKENLRLQLEKQGIFFPIILENLQQKKIKEKARELLENVKYLTNQGFRKIYITYFTDQEEANEIKKAYRQGKRVTHAIKNNTFQAKLFTEIESLLKTEEFKKLRTFYIAPVSINKSDDEPPNEIIVKSELTSLEEKLDQGHAVICLTDESVNPLSTPELLTLTQEKFTELNKKFPVSIERPFFSNALLEESMLNPEEIPDDISEDEKDEDYFSVVKRNTDIDTFDISTEMPEESIPSIPSVEEDYSENSIKFLFSLLEDKRKLTNWPLNIKASTEVEQQEIFKAITLPQKQSFLIKKIEQDSAFPLTKEQIAKLNEIKTSIEIRKADTTLPPEVSQFSVKYRKKLADYFAGEKALGSHEDPASKVNRIRLAKMLHDFLDADNLFNPYNFNPYNLKNNHDFLDMIESVESYAEQLRGTDSTLQPILSDMMWEARLVTKRIREKPKHEQIIEVTYHELIEYKSLRKIQKSPFRLRQFSDTHASKLLQYVNQRQSSWSYNLATHESPFSNLLSDSYLEYTRTETVAHIAKANEIANRLLVAQTEDDLYAVILEASAYKNELLSGTQSKGSNLIQVINNLEKAFKRDFKYRPLLGPKPIDEVWREEFGSHQFMDHKISSELHEYKKNNNKHKKLENGNLDVLMSDSTLYTLQDYFNGIKANWDSPSFNKENDFCYLINSYLNKNKQKNIHDLEFSDMLELLFKTLSPKSNELLDREKNKQNHERGMREVEFTEWFEMLTTPKSIDGADLEEVLLGNLSMRLRDIEVYEYHTLKPNSDIPAFYSTKPCDLYFIDGTITALDYKIFRNSDIDIKFNQRDYKAILANRILPCLIDANKNHPEGFLLTTPILGENNSDSLDIIYRAQFPLILHEIIQENLHRLGNLKGVVITGMEEKSLELKDLNGIFFLASNDNTSGLIPQLNQKISKGNLEEEYFTVSLNQKSRFSYPGKSIYEKDPEKNVQFGIDNNTNLATRLTNAKGIFDYKQKKYLPVDETKTAGIKPLKESWYSEFYFTENEQTKLITNLKIGSILADIVKPESLLQKRAYQLLNQPMNKKDRHVCMCAMADALASSKLESNKQLGRRLQEKIGPDFLEQMKNKYSTIYYAQLCLAQLEEKELTELKSMRRLGFKGKLIYHLNEFIKIGYNLPKLHDTLKNICNEIDKVPNTFYNRFFVNNKNLKLKQFIEQFNQSLEKEHPELVKENKQDLTYK